MKYSTAPGESRVANIARGKPRVLYLSQDPHLKLYILYKGRGGALSVLLYFTLKDVFYE